MTVLGIETATTVCAAATVRDGTVIAEDSLEERYIHAERIMGFVQKAVTAAGGLHAIDAIAVSIGPGSFTGLRIGLSVAKGLAYAADLKIVAVPTLEAIAWRLLRAGAVAPGERILTVLPARRGEAFAAYYRVVGGASEPESRRSPLVGLDFPEGTLSREPDRQKRLFVGRLAGADRGPAKGPSEKPVDAGAPVGRASPQGPAGGPVPEKPGLLRLEQDVTVRPVAELAAEAAASGALVAGDPGLLLGALPSLFEGLPSLSEDLSSTMKSLAPGTKNPPQARTLRAADPRLSGASAVAVAELGIDLLRAGRVADPESLEPAYALDFVALTKRP